MSCSRGLKCCLNLNHVLVLFFVVCSLFLVDSLAVAKNVNHHHQDMSEANEGSCDGVRSFFDTINVTVPDRATDSGSICSGRCCSNATEDELMMKSTNNFKQILRHHTRSLRGILESTATIFRENVIQLSLQSENKTLNLFNQVYRRMSPFSRQPISDLYQSIRSHISPNSYTDNLDIEKVVTNFFVSLFPVAYHHVLHAESDTHSSDFHVDYKNCLMHTFDDIQPFGDIPKTVARSLQQSVGAATVFVRALDRGADVLASTEELDSEYLTHKCKMHLLKMSYCPVCRGYAKGHVKSCSSYCINVMRGCLTQYVGSLDSPWTSFAESMERLLGLVRTREGIEAVIKTLEVKLSEAIMHAMQNGPELEKKVKKACGAPTLLPTEKTTIVEKRMQLTGMPQKWMSPLDPDMLRFLSTIDKSKDFYSKIVTSICDDEEYEREDKGCWTGDRIGEYSHGVMPTGANSQKYNPEVPLENPYRANTKINELVDKLINLRQTVANAISQHSNHVDSDKMQSDMAEGSAWSSDNIDDTDLDGVEASGSGDGGIYGRAGSVPFDTTRSPAMHPGGVAPPGHGGAAKGAPLSRLLVVALISIASMLASSH
ncbi:division abnormally delayed protein [Phlebotomus argentipes]|uniref:division abnormally delayed protein n=1 Tax=Phlebotomus argentipes TaxID=94469 RepID=UPI0028935B6C|nr:division abnormally delayed protein [Phlebotomus argentipes]